MRLSSALLICGAVIVCGCGDDNSSRCDELMVALTPPGTLFDAETREEFAERGKEWQAAHAEDFAQFDELGCELPPD